jgi:hypothetical protein
MDCKIDFETVVRTCCLFWWKRSRVQSAPLDSKRGHVRKDVADGEVTVVTKCKLISVRHGKDLELIKSGSTARKPDQSHCADAMIQFSRRHSLVDDGSRSSLCLASGTYIWRSRRSHQHRTPQSSAVSTKYSSCLALPTYRHQQPTYCFILSSTLPCVDTFVVRYVAYNPGFRDCLHELSVRRHCYPCQRSGLGLYVEITTYTKHSCFTLRFFKFPPFCCRLVTAILTSSSVCILRFMSAASIFHPPHTDSASTDCLTVDYFPSRISFCHQSAIRNFLEHA